MSQPSPAPVCRSSRRAPGIRRTPARSARAAGPGPRTAWPAARARASRPASRSRPRPWWCRRTRCPSRTPTPGSREATSTRTCARPGCGACSWAASRPTTASSTPSRTRSRAATPRCCSATRSAPSTSGRTTGAGRRRRWSAWAPSRSAATCSLHERRVRRPAHRSLPAHHAARVRPARHGRDGRVRALRAQPAAHARLPPRRGARAGARVPGDLALHRRGAGVGGARGPLRPSLRRLPGAHALHRRRARAARGHRLLRGRADPARHGAASRGAARGEPATQPAALPDARRLQGGARGAGGAREAARRLRHATRARRGGGAARGTRELPRRARGERDRARESALRHPGLRHRGALLRAGARRRGGGVRALRRRRSRARRAPARHLRHGGRGGEGGRARARGRRGARRAARQRRPGRARAPGPAHPRRGRARRGDHLRERQPGRRRAARSDRQRRADRRLRPRHAPRHFRRRALSRLRLQAGRVRRAAAAQALRRQGELAGPEAGLAAPRGRRPYAPGRPRARGRPAGRYGAPGPRHARRAAPRPSPVARRVPRARRRRARAASRAAPPPRARRRLPGDRHPGAPRPGRDAGRSVSFRLTAPGDDWLAAVPPLAALDRGPMPARVGNVGFGTASWTDRTLLASRAFYPPAASTPERRPRYYARHFPVVEGDATHYALPSAPHARAWAARTPPAFAVGVKAYAPLTRHPLEPARLDRDLLGELPPRPCRQRGLYASELPEAVLGELWRRFHVAPEPLRAAGKL